MKKGIHYIIPVLILSCILFINTSSRLPGSLNKKSKTGDAPGFVIMELFTSQGCSSCPPADEILGMYALKNDEHIIPLAFHVDYWNRLGWIDSFSGSIYSQRQRDYVNKLKTESVYTPQLIINGEKQMVGSDKNKIDATIKDYLKEKAAVKINITAMNLIKNKATVDYTVSAITGNTNINAALVQKKITTQIRAGENQGVKLTNYNIVRNFKTKQLVNSSGSFILELPEKNIADNYMVVLFVQDNASGSIRGSASANCKQY